MGFDGRQEDVNLGEDAGQRRQSGEAQHQRGQREGHARTAARQAREISDRFDRLAVATHRLDADEDPDIGDGIEGQIEQHALHAHHGAGGETEQRVAHMADGAVGHQALDVGLADGGEGAQPHRQHRDELDDLAPLLQRVGERDDDGADEHREGCDFRGGGEKGDDRGRRAFVNVRRPHMERHGGKLERQAGDQEDQPEDQADADARRLDDMGDAGEFGGAGEAVDQRDAVEQHPGGQRAEDEIFQAGLGGAQRIAVEGGQHIERQALQFEAEIERQEIRSRNHQQHAERRKPNQNRQFKADSAFVLEEALGHQHAERGGGQDHQLGEAREAVDDEGPVEGAGVGRHEHEIARCDHQQDHEYRQEVRRLVAASRADQERRHGADRQDQLGQQSQKIGLDIHRTSPRLASLI